MSKELHKKTLVVGGGGTGQSNFMTFLNINGIETNSARDGDGLKHIHFSMINKRINNYDKCIFIYCHPYKSLRSHYRRKWAGLQYKKMNKQRILDKITLNNFDKYKSLVLKSKKDEFGFEAQFESWLNLCPVPIYFLEFNDLHLKQDEINNFLNSNINFNVFEMKERNCNAEPEDDEMFQLYDKLYKKMLKEAINSNEKNLRNLKLE